MQFPSEHGQPPRSRRLKTDHPLYRVNGGHHAKEVSTCGVSLLLGHPGVVQAGVEHSVCSSIAGHLGATCRERLAAGHISSHCIAGHSASHLGFSWNS